MTAHTFTETKEWTSIGSCDHYIHYYSCKCGYHYTYTKPHQVEAEWHGTGNRLIDFKACSNCGAWIYQNACQDASGKRIGCNNPGTCVRCGHTATANTHYLAQGTCELCKKMFFKETSGPTITYSSDYKTCSIMFTITPMDSSCSLTGVESYGWTSTPNWSSRSMSSVLNSDGSRTFTQKITFNTAIKSKAYVGYSGNGLERINGINVFEADYPQVCIWYDHQAPIQNDVIQKDQASANGWATIKQLTLSGTENNSDIVYLTVSDKVTGEKYITDAAVHVTDGKYSYTCTPSIEGDANGRTYVVTAKDRIGNTSTKEFVVSKTDGSYPKLKEGTSLSYTDWTNAAKNISLSFFDFGAGGVEASLDNQTDYKSLTKSGEYYIWNHSFGNQTGTTEHTIYVKDALGNAGSYKFTVGNTDNTAYSISYNLNGGSLSGQKTSYTVADSFTLPQPTKTGYTFSGWTGNNSTTPQKTVTVNKGSRGNLSYTANWSANSCFITFDGNGGSLYISDPTIVKNDNGTATAKTWYDTNCYYILGIVPTRQGYIFKGFYDAPSGGIQVFKPYDPANCLSVASKYYNENNIWKYAGNVTFYAQWTPIHYTIKYDANGGTGTMADQSITYEGYTKVRPNTFTKSGYTFGGWYASRIKDGVTQYLYTSTGSNWEWYDEGKQPSGYRLYLYRYDETTGRATTIDGDVITLHAQWTVNTYTNKLNHWACGMKYGEGNNGDKDCFLIGDTPYTKNYGETYVMDDSWLIKIPNGYYPTRTTGFFTFASNGTTNGFITRGFGYKFTQNDNNSYENLYHELYYRPYDYTITYNLNGGTNNSANPSTYNVLYGVSLKAPTRAGYTFTGWYDENSNKITGVNEGCNATFSSADDLYAKLATRTTGNRTLTAKWTPITWTTKYDANGGSGTMENTTHRFGCGDPIRHNQFIRPGWTMTGWTYSRVRNGITEWLYGSLEGYWIDAEQWYEFGKNPDNTKIYVEHNLDEIDYGSTYIDGDIHIAHAQWQYNPVSVKVPQILTGDHTGKSQFRVKCDDFKTGNIKVSVPSSFSYKQTGKSDVTATITAKSGNNIITPTNKVCVYDITTKSGLTAGCWQGSFNIGLTLTKE